MLLLHDFEDFKLALLFEILTERRNHLAEKLGKNAHNVG